MIRVFVGTSGWMYDWNPRGNFDWYVRNSGLNAVELNASFYRFPFPNQVASWARKGRTLRWAVKVHRSITHVRRLRETCYETWRRFVELFRPLDPYIDFYLLQLPPTFTASESNIERVRAFARFAGLGPRLAIEFRHESWFRDSTVDLCREINATVVSIDAPIGTWIAASSDAVYMRMHGRTAWYAHDYSIDELEEVAERIVSLRPQRIYVFFNNDHWMLENARTMLRILNDMVAELGS